MVYTGFVRLNGVGYLSKIPKLQCGRWRFPSFLENLEQEGVDMRTIVRLTKFHELNVRPSNVVPFCLLVEL